MPPNTPPCDPTTRIERRIKTEVRAAVTCLMPRTDEDFRQSMTRILVVGWLIWTFGIAGDVFSQGDVVVFGFTFYQLTGLIVLYFYGRIHDVELKQLPGFGSSSSEQLDRRERETERRERKREREQDRSGFRYGDDRRDDDQ